MKRIINLISVISLVLFITGYSQIVDKYKKQSAIVESDGYAFLSEDKTIKQIREEALSNAKREALEKGQTYIKSTSKVENFQLKYDLIQSDTEGFVKIIESTDNGITSDNRYHYWIKAEIEYSIKEEDKKEFNLNPNSPLNVELWSDKCTYNEGDKIYIFMKGNKEFYARIIYLDSQGNKIQLVPNQHRTNNKFNGGEKIQIPEKFDNFELVVSPPFGSDQIVLYASSAPQGDVKSEKYGESLYKIDNDINTIGMNSRGVKIIKKDENAINGAEFYEITYKIVTTK